MVCAAAQTREKKGNKMVAVFLFLMLLILFLMAIGSTALVCWLTDLTFSWGVVALVWLFLLIAAVFVGSGGRWE